MIHFDLHIADPVHNRRVFRLKAEPTATVLDVLEALRLRQASSVPAYRHSCHHGSCGTCGALINGTPALMCLTRLDSVLQPALAPPELVSPATSDAPSDTQTPAVLPVLTVEALPGFELVSGIAVYPGRFFDSFPADLDYLVEVADKPDLPTDHSASQHAAFQAGTETPGSGAPDVAKRTRFEQCIECGVCRAACPVSAPFIGPAALAAINRQLQKKPALPSSIQKKWLDLAGRPDGAAACQRHLACSRLCPQAVYPGKHIQLLKNRLLKQ